MKNLKNILMPALALLSLCLLQSSCYKDGTDHISDAVRISLYPAPSGFAADGSTNDGAETYSAVVTVNYGASVSMGAWTAEILESPLWAVLKYVEQTSTYPDTWGTGIHEYQEKGIELSVEANAGGERSLVLRITSDSGEFSDYVIRQEAGR
ncbi:MAG: hypothetical protein NC308_02125 [Clostridium sp.]|nr:hypothetical protein [Bacteroides sp.]MCM1197661.1 hypothetical protein [Clostridium sp.]